MANVLSTDFDYTYNGKEAIEAFIKPIIQNPDIKRLFQVRTGIKDKEQLFLSEATMRNALRAKSADCSITYQTGTNLTNRTINTTQLISAYEQCEAEFESTFWVNATKSGSDVDDITGTEIDRIIKQKISDELKLDVFRLFCFGQDSDPDPFYGTMDGMWPLLIAGLSDYCVNQASTTFTTGTSFTSTEVKDVFTSLYADADPILKQLPTSEKAIYVTGNVHDAYLNYLESQNNEFGAMMEVNGLQVPTFRGIPVVPIYDWDQALEDTTCPLFGQYTKLALYTTPKNHIMGVDAANDDAKMEQWFSKDDRKVKYLTQFRMGYQYIHCDLQIIAIA